MYSSDRYSNIIYGSEYIDTENISQFIVNLMDYLPHFYKNSDIQKSIQLGLGDEIASINYIINDILKQLFVETCTWGIELWEDFVGIPHNKYKPLQHRREVVIARLRGQGTTTKELIKNVATAFSGGEVDVIEYPEEYKFIVKFIGVRGIPPNLSDLSNSIEDIKPAHLGFEYAYTYTLWGELSNWEVTWAEMATYTWGEVKTRVFD